MSTPRLFRDQHFRTPGYFKRQGSIYLWRLEDGRQQLMANPHGPAPFGALWSASGSMAKLRAVAERIIEANGKIASENGDHVVFSATPNLPPQTPRGLTNRPRVGPPSDVYFGQSHAQLVEKPKEQDDTEEEIRPQVSPRKKRKRRTVTAHQAEPSGDAVEDPAASDTLPETSTHGDKTV